MYFCDKRKHINMCCDDSMVSLRGLQGLSATGKMLPGKYNGPPVKTTERKNIVNHSALGHCIDFAAGERA